MFTWLRRVNTYTFLFCITWFSFLSRFIHPKQLICLIRIQVFFILKFFYICTNFSKIAFFSLGLGTSEPEWKCLRAWLVNIRPFTIRPLHGPTLPHISLWESPTSPLQPRDPITRTLNLIGKSSIRVSRRGNIISHGDGNKLLPYWVKREHGCSAIQTSPCTCGALSKHTCAHSFVLYSPQLHIKKIPPTLNCLVTKTLNHNFTR